MKRVKEKKITCTYTQLSIHSVTHPFIIKYFPYFQAVKNDRIINILFTATLIVINILAPVDGCQLDSSSGYSGGGTSGIFDCSVASSCSATSLKSCCLLRL